MILYDDKTLVIPVGLGGSGQSATLQDKSILITANGKETIIPDIGYDGLAKVTIETEVQSDIRNQEKNIFVPINKETVITPDEGFTGLSKVTAKGTANLEVIDFPIESNGSYTVSPGDNFDAISKINIEVDVPVQEIKNQTKNVQVPIKRTTVVTPDAGFTGLDKVIVTATAKLDNPNISITKNKEEFDIVPGDSYDAIGNAHIIVDVPSDIKNQSKTVDSSTNRQIVTPDSEYTGLDSVTVNPYKIQNRKVSGTLLVYNKEDVRSDYYTILPDEDNVGIKQINVRKTGILQNVTLDPSTNQQTWNVREHTTYQYGVRQISVNPVTSSIDSNIVPENIKKDIEILGVKGNYEPAVIKQEPGIPYITNNVDTVDGILDLGNIVSNKTFIIAITACSPTIRKTGLTYDINDPLNTTYGLVGCYTSKGQYGICLGDVDLVQNLIALAGISDDKYLSNPYFKIGYEFDTTFRVAYYRNEGYYLRSGYSVSNLLFNDLSESSSSTEQLDNAIPEGLWNLTLFGFKDLDGNKISCMPIGTKIYQISVSDPDKNLVYYGYPVQGDNRGGIALYDKDGNLFKTVFPDKEGVITYGVEH